MKACLSENKSSPFRHLGASMKKLSLRQRRIKSSDKITLSVSSSFKSSRDPTQALKEGAYDLNTCHLQEDNLEEFGGIEGSLN